MVYFMFYSDHDCYSLRISKGTGSYCCPLGERSGDIAWAGAKE